MRKCWAAAHWPWMGPVLSGLLIGTSYIPFPPWASLFCLVPLWLFWQRQQRLKPVVLGAFITSAIYTLIGFNWVTYTLHEFAQVNWLLAAVGMMLFALFGHLFLPVAGIVWFVMSRWLAASERESLLLMALLTALAEFYVPMLFKWNFGYSWYGAGLPLFQWAEFVGFTGLSMLTILANLAALHIWRHRQTWAAKAGLAASLVVFIGLNAGGIWLKTRLPAPDDTFDVLLVQANIGNAQKQAMEHGKAYRADILTRYFETTDDGLAQTPAVDFILWSETAFPSLLGGEYNSSFYADLLSQFVRNRQVALLTGAYGKDANGDITNSLFVIDPQGNVTEPHYSKTHLLALGEYIPGEATFPWLKQWLPMVSHFGRGPGPTMLLTVNGFKMGPQVCYESLFPEFSKGLADLGAQFIVNVTNDSWYGIWQEPWQHLHMTLARGVEFRRPVLRATNTGISTVALANGDVLPLSPLNSRWAASYHVPLQTQPQPTFYQRHFHLMPTLLWCGLLGLIGLRLGTRHFSHRFGNSPE
ncbi:MAG: apolipoprotein N-acyltransferase [Methylomonas sp.]|nr:apolipoprotein N-acyltransferase [Methylomonas sp.]PPD20527.1 MAG: apolipoprotein N-acyltransferase [Methylomonas sp.]PPD26832.1 MAG: apolipoprotein N-acyltransferase [Methylomonas sp.]PPD38696.1 MAG: apolipoprotein N-acyltransferase [Methylomonas sp.]PPD40825.1 MAG: apolipoprotein N-acyltransferase [Methylomonas sp.]